MQRYKFFLFVLGTFLSLVVILTIYPQLQKSFFSPLPLQTDTSILPLNQDPVIVAAGDIACDHETEGEYSCKQQQTANLIQSINPTLVLALGDLQYGGSSLADFQKYYDASWGQFKEKTRPVVGNHEYATRNAAGFFAYFGESGGEIGKGYYSFDIGASAGKWHVIGLNSNCWAAGGCAITSAQGKWLAQDLQNNKTTCTLVFLHHPLFSSGLHGAIAVVKPLWGILYQYNVDIVLSGHDHIYERFAKQDPNGNRSEIGIREFVVGTGGNSLYGFKEISINSEVRDNSTYGVLKLTLHNDSYDWQFVSTEPNGFTDAGSAQCNG